MKKATGFDLDKIPVEGKRFAVPRRGYTVELVLNSVEAAADKGRSTVEMSIHISDSSDTLHLIDFQDDVLEWEDLPRRPSSLGDWQRFLRLLDDGFSPNDAYLVVVSNFFFPDTKVDIELPGPDSETLSFNVQVPGIRKTFTGSMDANDFRKYFEFVK